ncbi:MAG TPA: hypothetical protein VKU40_17055 [Thermoanaerobaculia bacterium]|nr:hypothetical protein [Thermoanaerobaculia bacterium]
MSARKSNDPKSTPAPSGLSRRGLFRLAGAAAAAAATPGWVGGSAAAGAEPGADSKPSGALARFSTPALIKDLAARPALQEQLDRDWSVNANGWTEQAILGNPWTSLFASHQEHYFNPLHTDVSEAIQQQISWPAFPNRIVHYFPGLTLEQQWQFAETGTLNGGRAGQPLIYTTDVECGTLSGDPGQLDQIPFPPYGYRGWLDEYCEMAARRDGDGQLERVDFTCENPEYWYTLWRVDRGRVLAIYREILGERVKMEDLELSVDGRVVTDPSTGEPAYDPLNVWNRGTVMSDAGGGAMHLTSTPNTVQTEMGLAGAATVQRRGGNANGSQLICCAQYGQIYRNSDPHIGQVDNQIVGLGFRVSLANPIGLYLQKPDFRTWKLPDDPNLPAGATAEDLYQVVRGAETLPDFPDTYNFILHARVEIPEAWKRAGVSFTLSDVTINGSGLEYGSQIMQTFDVSLFPMAVAAEKPALPQPCVVSLPADGIEASAFPQQIMFEDLWDAYYGSAYPVPNRPGVTMNLASNTVIIAPRVEPGWEGGLALTGSAFAKGANGELPTVDFVDPETGETDDAIEVKARALENVVYAVPGNSEPGEQQLLRLDVKVGDGAKLGQRDLRVTNSGQSAAEAAKFFLLVERGDR